MEHLEIILPTVLLFIGFLLKLMIGRKYDFPVIIQAVSELPIDIKSKRFLVYRNYKELQEMIRKELKFYCK